MFGSTLFALIFRRLPVTKQPMPDDNLFQYFYRQEKDNIVKILKKHRMELFENPDYYADDLVNLLMSCLQYDPNKRLTAKELVNNIWFLK